MARHEQERPRLVVDEEAWWFVTSPIGRNVDGKNRRKFEGAARVRVLAADDEDPDCYHVQILTASGPFVETRRDLGVEPVVHRRDLFRVAGEEHRQFGEKVALATREDRR